MWKVWNWALVLLLAATAPVKAASLSGTYVGTGPDISVLLQLVETAGGQLSGRYEQQKLVGGNRIEQLNASVSGTSDGQTVVLHIRPTEVLTGTYVLSGMVAGSVLQINGGGYGQTFHLSLAKGSEDEYKIHAAGIVSSANRASLTQTLDTELVTAERVLEAMSKFSANPEPSPSAFVPYEQRYRELTQRMHAALGQQQSIPRFIQTPARGQIDVAINQAAIETTQIHDEVKSKQGELQQKVTAMFNKIILVAKRCGEPRTQLDVAPQTLEKLALICARIPPIAKQFETDIKRIGNSFEKIEAVWREEQGKQLAIVRSADLAAR